MNHQGSTGKKSVPLSGRHGGASGNCCWKTMDHPSLTLGEIVAPGPSDPPDHAGYTYRGETVLEGSRGVSDRPRLYQS